MIQALHFYCIHKRPAFHYFRRTDSGYSSHQLHHHSYYCCCYALKRIPQVTSASVDTRSRGSCSSAHCSSSGPVNTDSQHSRIPFTRLEVYFVTRFQSNRGREDPLMASNLNSYRSISLPNPPLMGLSRHHRCGPSISKCAPATVLINYPCYLDFGIERRAILSPSHYLELGTACVQAGLVTDLDCFSNHSSHRRTRKIQNLHRQRVSGAFFDFQVRLVSGWVGCHRQIR